MYNVDDAPKLLKQIEAFAKNYFKENTGHRECWPTLRETSKGLRLPQKDIRLLIQYEQADENLQFTYYNIPGADWSNPSGDFYIEYMGEDWPP